MNEQNTVASHTTCPAHLEVWRKKAAEQAADDRFTVLFNELVDAFGDIDVSSRSLGYYQGLRDAYVLISGDPQDVVERQVRNALDRQIREELAESASVPVPS